MSAAVEKENRSIVVVIYDDPTTRARALTACDYLVSQHWENVELDFYWWRTDFLDDANMSRAAAHYAHKIWLRYHIHFTCLHSDGSDVAHPSLPLVIIAESGAAAHRTRGPVRGVF